MAFKLDWSKFKKTGGDAHSTEMRHDDGHTITIQHKALDPQSRKLIAKLPVCKADGGMIDDVPEPDPKKAKEMQDGATKGSLSAIEMLRNLHDGLVAKPSPKPVQKFVNGGEALPVDNGAADAPAPAQAPVTINIGQPAQAAAQTQPMPQPRPDEFQDMVNTLNPARLLTGDAAGQQQAHDAAMASLPKSPAEAPAGSPITAPAPAQAPAAVPPPATQPEARGPAAAAPSQMDAYAGNVKGAVGQEIKGLGERMGAEKELGQAQSGIEAQSLKQSQNAMADYQAAQAAARQSQEQLMHDINNSHVDPQRLWHNASTGQKVAGIIGIIMSGFGSGGGRENLALKTLNEQITRDIDAQKQDVENKKSLYSFNLQQFRNETDAASMTRVQLNDIALHKLSMAAAENKTPQAQAAYDIAAGELKKQNALLMSTVGANGQSGSAAHGDPIEQQLQVLRLAAPERAKEIESRYIPGVGVATVPVDQKSRDALVSHQQFDKQASDLINWVKKHEGTVVDRGTVAEGKAMAAELAGAYRQASQGGVYKESEQNFINKLIPDDPSQFLASIRTLPKLQELQRNNGNRFNLLKRSVGLPVQGGGQGAASGYQPKSFKPSK